MRFLLILSILLFSVTAVDAETWRLQATSAQSTISPDFNYEYNSWSEWEDVNVVCSMDIESSRLIILNQYEDDFILNGQPTVTKGQIDTDGDTYNRYVYTAMDSDGDKCNIRMDIWQDFNIVTITVYYSGMAYRYQCNVIN